MVVDDVDRSRGQNPLGVESISDEESDLLSVGRLELGLESTVSGSSLEVVSAKVVEHGGNVGGESRGIILNVEIESVDAHSNGGVLD